jgi:hypothetical protein
MSDRELHATIRQRFTALRSAIKQRHTELIIETEAQLLEQYRAESERADELDRRLQEITDDANRKAVALLREFEDLADGGRWSGGRAAIFEAPRLARSHADRTRRHRALLAGIDNQIRQAMRLLDRQQTTLLRTPGLAQTFLARSIPAFVTDLVPAERLQEIDAQLVEDARQSRECRTFSPGGQRRSIRPSEGAA